MARNLLRSFLKLFKYDIIKLNRQVSLPVDFEEEHAKIIRKVAAYTMTSPERIFGLIEAVKYIGHFKIEGDIVECGVCREDISVTDQSADELLKKETDKEKNLVWAFSTLDTVKKTMSLSGYDPGKIHYIRGKVEETIPAKIPERIALLRLDTDWYESTKHELNHLFPRLQRGGVLIIDDYGHWKGARKAVDEYFKHNNIHILLNRMDETGRIAIKQ